MLKIERALSTAAQILACPKTISGSFFANMLD